MKEKEGIFNSLLGEEKCGLTGQRRCQQGG